MSLPAALAVVVVSGLYTSLWGAFKDCPYEGFKRRTFLRSVYFHLAILAALLVVPSRRAAVLGLGAVQLFYLVMGIERFLAEIYKGFFRTEDQEKYFVPSRITFFGHHVGSDLLRRGVGTAIVAVVFAVALIDVRVDSYWAFLAVAYGSGLVVALGGAYKDAPFEGFKPLKFQRSALVLAAFSPLFYLLNDPQAPVTVGFLIYMNGGLERFAVEYYKTYIKRNMSGKFRPDLTRIPYWTEHREPFHLAALLIIAVVLAVAIVESARVQASV